MNFALSDCLGMDDSECSYSELVLATRRHAQKQAQEINRLRQENNKLLKKNNKNSSKTMKKPHNLDIIHKRLNVAFTLGIDQFDPVIEKCYQDSAYTFLKLAKLNAHTNNSDLVKIYAKMQKFGLNKALKNEETLIRAKALYKALQGYPKVSNALYQAITASKSEKGETRQKKWQKFRETANDRLTLLAKITIPKLQPAKPKSRHPLTNFIAKNVNLKLSTEQQIHYQALQIVLYSFRQIQRRYDPKTDYGLIKYNIPLQPDQQHVTEYPERNIALCKVEAANAHTQQ